MLNRLIAFTLVTSSLLAQGSERKNYRELFEPLPLPGSNEMRLGSGHPGAAYWQQRADYRMKINLDPATRLVRGKETIKYTNNAQHALSYLWMSLDQNLFKRDSLAAGLSGRARRALGDDLGFKIQSMTSGGQDLEYQVHDTMARIECPQPVKASGGTIELEIEWTFIVPKPGMRMGVTSHPTGDVFALSNWFPAIAVYDDVNGWNTLPYLGSGEFYQTFGSYHVDLTVPRDHIVSGTGVLQNPEDVLPAKQLEAWKRSRTSDTTVIIRSEGEARSGGGRPAGDRPVTWTFKADDVRSFAWASSKAFIWDASGLDGSHMQSFYPPSALPLWKDATEMLHSSVAGYNKRWFKYPYPAANNVNALGQGGGMEFPMIIFNGRERSNRGLYFLIAHEIGHQWFPMIVNTDERRHPWMDEGFNTFINYYAMLDRFGKPDRQYSLSVLKMMQRMAGNVPVSAPPDHAPGAVGVNAYFKPARMMIVLREAVLGPDRFDRAFRAYINAWAFKQPQPADFFRLMEDAAGMDLDWFWRSWIYETHHIDLAVTKAVVRDGSLRITFESLGDGVAPVPYAITFDDGSTRNGVVPVVVWTRSTKKTVTVPLTGAAKPVKVEIDASKVIPEKTRSNNVIDL
ncbi:MAG: peptidase [Planctomycetes bacterium]|nr:peptidase [Planctomycetota bacterium]